MSSALIGFIGVIAGVLAGGGIQWMLARSDRKRDARVAASVLSGDLITAFYVLQLDLDADVSAYFESWASDRRAFAAGSKPLDFHIVANAFKSIELLATTPPPRRDDPRTPGLVNAIEMGATVAWRASGITGPFEPPSDLRRPDRPRPGTANGRRRTEHGTGPSRE
jgi:hypothetical protein